MNAKQIRNLSHSFCFSHLFLVALSGLSISCIALSCARIGSHRDNATLIGLLENRTVVEGSLMRDYAYAVPKPTVFSAYVNAGGMGSFTSSLYCFDNQILWMVEKDDRWFSAIRWDMEQDTETVYFHDESLFAEFLTIQRLGVQRN